ncbi:hypothetical protein CU097_012764, partial [Rhizopus azygosporus]
MIEQEEHQKQDTLTGSNRKLDLIRHRSALAGADIYQEYWHYVSPGGLKVNLGYNKILAINNIKRLNSKNA